MEALANHPGVGVLIVRSREHGLICVGASTASSTSTRTAWRARTRWRYTASTPSAAFQRLDAIEHVGDIAVISLYDPETGEIAAFEELIGAHGGLGGAQTRPFLLLPAPTGSWTSGPLVGAPMVYQQLRRWMERELGMTFGSQG